MSDTKYHPPKYERIAIDEVPEGLHWDTPRKFQGQMILREYGDHGLTGLEQGAPYMRISDNGQVRYYIKVQDSYWA